LAAEVFVELMRALGALSERPAPEHARLTDLLGLPAPPPPGAQESVFLFQAYPFASVYLNVDGMIGGLARDRVAGFWRAIEVDPPDDPDHLAALFGLYAELRHRERAESDPGRCGAYRHAAGALIQEHIASWLWPFLGAVRDAGSSFHRAWAQLVERVVEAELARFEPQTRPSVHLDEVPKLPDPRREGGRPFVAALLAPARTGIVLTRSTLSRLGTDRELGMRAGERRFVIEHFLAQDPGATLQWLAQECERWAARYAESSGPEVVRTFWGARARASGSLLTRLAVTSEVPGAQR
jgi:hypothetical protein